MTSVPYGYSVTFKQLSTILNNNSGLPVHPLWIKLSGDVLSDVVNLSNIRLQLLQSTRAIERVEVDQSNYSDNKIPDLLGKAIKLFDNTVQNRIAQQKRLFELSSKQAKVESKYDEKEYQGLIPIDINPDDDIQVLYFG